MRMQNLIKRSIVARISTYMFIVYLLAMVSILASFTIAERTRGDAAALNISGSLRMQTFRILNTINSLTSVHTDEADAQSLLTILHDAVHEFSRRLVQDDLINSMPKATDQSLLLMYQTIEQKWFNEIKPSLLALDQFDRAIYVEFEEVLQTQFAHIDQMVSALEQNTENKIRLLLFIQFSCLAFAIVIILVSAENLRKKIVNPLKRLMILAEEAAKHNFTVRSGLSGEDELTALGHTFDDMATQLSASYANLEARVAKKTIELEKSHRALQLLHDASHHLYENAGDLCRGAVPILKAVEKLLDIGPTSVYLTSNDAQTNARLMTTQTVTRPAYCRDHSCNACIESDHEVNLREWDQNSENLVIPIYAAKEQLGVIEIQIPTGRNLSERALKLLDTLADQIGTAIFVNNKNVEKQKLSLLEERSVIARELHDSLAQSLSYLKMQVSRLQKVQQKEPVSQTQTMIIDELRNGLNKAYGQLRELLTTFRLQLNQPTLKEALNETVKEFAIRMDAEINLNYSLPYDLLNPNEEVHLLQIVREALANTHKHAQASRADIHLNFSNSQVHLIVKDNGIGLKDGKIPENHYGLIIMRDRSMTLGGQLSIENHPQGGVSLSLKFTPSSVSANPSVLIFPNSKPNKS